LLHFQNQTDEALEKLSLLKNGLAVNQKKKFDGKISSDHFPQLLKD